MGHIRRIVDNTKERIKRVDYSRLYNAGMGFWILVVLIFLLGFLFIVYIQDFIGWIVSDYGYLGIFAASFITDLLVQPIGPDVPLVLGVFAGMNPWVVFIFVLMGSYISLIVAYYLGKTLGAAGIERIMGKKSFAKLEKYKLGGKWFMFIGALTPVPYVPYLAGLWQFSFKDTLIYVVLPRTVRFAFVLWLAYALGIRII